MHPRNKCFRCGKDFLETGDRGQITISGYYTPYSQPYYGNYNLCEDCNVKLNRIIGEYLMGGTDGNTDNAR